MNSIIIKKISIIIKKIILWTIFRLREVVYYSNPEITIKFIVLEV
jgi:hypothetical protein